MTIISSFLSLPFAAVVLYAAVLVAGVAYVTIRNTIRFLHLLQLDSYQCDGYLRTLKRNRADVRPFYSVVLVAVVGETIACALNIWVSVIAGCVVSAVTFALYMALGLEIAKQRRAQKQKKELVWTERMKRLYRCTRVVCVAVCAVCVGIAVLVCNAIISIEDSPAAWLFGILFSTVVAAWPLCMVHQWVRLAAHLREKPEQKINQRFIDDAKRIIQSRPDLKRIGITGSYGKTSTKFILGAILKQKYHPLVPPASYNTPMGITRMLREMLTDENDVIIAEMGARHIHEIAELCEIIPPQYSLLTSVGNQHLETFGSQENITNTKYEIMQALGPDGIGFFPEDHGICKQLYQRFTGNKRLFGIDGDDLDVWAEAIQTGPFGSSFDLVQKSGERIACTCKLLGRHNVMNVLGCAAVALEMGLTMEQVAAGIAQAEPVEHRLQLIDPGTGSLVIDDAFNSNPTGTQAAMDVLASFDGYRKICITPGMVELGAEEERENEKFGARMAPVCDIVILVGKTRAVPMERGLLQAGFDQKNIFIAENLDDASAILALLARPRDVVLFENDLPDHYEQ